MIHYTLPSIDNHGNMTMVVTSIHDNENDNDGEDIVNNKQVSMDQKDDLKEEVVCFCSPIVQYLKNVLGSYLGVVL